MKNNTNYVKGRKSLIIIILGLGLLFGSLWGVLNLIFLSQEAVVSNEQAETRIYDKNLPFQASGLDLARYNFSTYLGSPGTDTGSAIAVDHEGNVYLTGHTNHASFPVTEGAYQTEHSGGGLYDVFVIKFDQNGELVYSTFIGGSDDEYAYGIAVNDQGEAFITGYTRSTTHDPPNNIAFPTTPGVINETGNGGPEIFVAGINSNGTDLLFSTFLGGGAYEAGRSIAISDGLIAITGNTQSSSGFPVTENAINTTLGGSTATFAVVMTIDGEDLVYSTLITGEFPEYGEAITFASETEIVIGGYTNSSEFPTTPDALFPEYPGGSFNGFVSKIDFSSGELVYSTFLGGGLNDRVYDLALCGAGNYYLTGLTHSNNFPVTPDALINERLGTNMAYLSILAADGSELLYSTYFGGGGSESASSIVLDNEGCAYILGQTLSYSLPTTEGALASHRNTTGQRDIFLTKFSPDGTALRYSTYIPSSGMEYGNAIAVDDNGMVYFVGRTDSTNYPVTSGAFNETNNGGLDICLTKLYVFEDLIPDALFTPNATNIVEGQSVAFSFEGSPGNEPAEFQWDFGDGSANSTEINPIHQYTNEGTFWAELTVTDDTGRVDSHSVEITVQINLQPDAIFSANFTEIVQWEWIAFTHEGSPGNEPAEFQWNFGDGSPNSTETNPVHQYTTYGEYTATLTITDLNDDVSVHSIQVRVFPELLPVANFTASRTLIIEGDSVDFTFTGFKGNEPTIFQWDFGEGGDNVTTVNASNTFTTAGNYTVILTLEDDSGETSVFSKEIEVVVNITPIAAFSLNNSAPAVGDYIGFAFTGNSGNEPTLYEWNFGDGTTSNEKNPNHRYATSGIFTVTLTVTDMDGETSTQSLMITVVEPAGTSPGDGNGGSGINDVEEEDDSDLIEMLIYVGIGMVGLLIILRITQKSKFKKKIPNLDVADEVLRNTDELFDTELDLEFDD